MSGRRGKLLRLRFHRARSFLLICDVALICCPLPLEAQILKRFVQAVTSVMVTPFSPSADIGLPRVAGLVFGPILAPYNLGKSAGDVVQTAASNYAANVRAALAQPSFQEKMNALSPASLLAVTTLQELRSSGVVKSEQECRALAAKFTDAATVASATYTGDPEITSLISDGAHDMADQACTQTWAAQGPGPYGPSLRPVSPEYPGAQPMPYNWIPRAPFVVADCPAPAGQAPLLIMSNGDVIVAGGSPASPNYLTLGTVSADPSGTFYLVFHQRRLFAPSQGINIPDAWLGIGFDGRMYVIGGTAIFPTFTPTVALCEPVN